MYDSAYFLQVLLLPLIVLLAPIRIPIWSDKCTSLCSSLQRTLTLPRYPPRLLPMMLNLLQASYASHRHGGHSSSSGSSSRSGCPLLYSQTRYHGQKNLSSRATIGVNPVDWVNGFREGKVGIHEYKPLPVFENL